MLVDHKTPLLSDLDRQVFDVIVSQEHYLRQVAEHVDFERFRPRLAEAYSLRMGRPAIDPVRMLKILFLRFHYKLSDRQVMERTKTDMGFRWFLGLGLYEKVPNHTDGTYFRKRVGVERFAQILQDLVGLAREAGLVRDRLRLKDATHLIADVARAGPLQLAAQVREGLLQAAAPLFPDWAAQQRVDIDLLRQTTAEFADEERLAARIEYLRGMAVQIRERVAEEEATTATNRAQERLQRVLKVVDKLLADQADPEGKDKLASNVDPDARAGWHHQYFVGYLLDMALDADSGIITSVNVLPGNGPEAADAVVLIQQEEAAQNNDVAGLSMDGVGYNGPVLRELTDPNGLNLDVTVPPPKVPPRSTFGPDRFTLTVINDTQREVTCPNGQATRRRQRTRHDTGDRYIFNRRQCAGCPLRTDCLQNPNGKQGREVIKNDYEAEYKRVEEKARTPEYEQTRRTHPKIERKFNELMRHHSARRASFRGLPKVLIQSVLTVVVVNVKQMLKLLAQKTKTAIAALPVRAELAPT